MPLWYAAPQAVASGVRAKNSVAPRIADSVCVPKLPATSEAPSCARDERVDERTGGECGGQGACAGVLYRIRIHPPRQPGLLSGRPALRVGPRAAHNRRFVDEILPALHGERLHVGRVRRARRHLGKHAGDVQIAHEARERGRRAERALRDARLVNPRLVVVWHGLQHVHRTKGRGGERRRRRRRRGRGRRRKVVDLVRPGVESGINGHRFGTSEALRLRRCKKPAEVSETWRVGGDQLEGCA